MKNNGLLLQPPNRSCYFPLISSLPRNVSLIFFSEVGTNIKRVVRQIPAEILNNADLQDIIRRVNISGILYLKIHVYTCTCKCFYSYCKWYSQGIKPDTILNFVMCGAVQKFHCVPLCDRCLRNFMFEFIIFVFF